MLYALDVRNGVHVYDLGEPSKPQSYDWLDMQNFTSLNAYLQVNGNTILIMFFHKNRNVVAEFSYYRTQQKFTFLRYFKFKANVNEMHLM